jgi:hypothetical protein
MARSFFVRFAVLEAVVAVTAAVAGASLRVGSDWSSGTLTEVALATAFFVVTGTPGAAMLAVAATNPPRLAWAGAGLVAVIATVHGMFSATVDESSTAGLAFLWFPLVTSVAGVVAVVAWAIAEERRPPSEPRPR